MQVKKKTAPLNTTSSCTKGKLLTTLFLLWLWIAVVHFPSRIQSGTSSTSTTPTTDFHLPAYCTTNHYNGVLLISQGDRNGAAGTIFYLFILNQLLYAEKHNLQPWIHLNNVSRHVYDPTVHQPRDLTTAYTFPNQLQLTWAHFYDPLSNKTYSYPGKPIPSQDAKGPVTITVQGTGVWNSYFHSKVPILLSPDDPPFQQDLTRPCSNLPILNLNTDDQLVRGLHLVCPYCARSWKYGGVPPSLKLPNNYQKWWAPMRQQASQIVKTYYHPLHPPSTHSHCLALHIRHSDKANKRDKIPLAVFLPYCQAYVEATPNNHILYLATDSSRIVDKIQTEWPASVLQRMTWQDNIVRSPNETAVFDGWLGARHHDRTNREVLYDIQQMASCQWLLHGLSAVSEAVVYTNPHQQTINLEFYTYYQRHNHAAQQPDNDAPMTVEEFRQRLRRDH